MAEDEMRLSINERAPWLGQGDPVYPPLYQTLRVYAAAVLGTNVYPCFVQQFVPPLSLRDREMAYVQEPNNTLLGAGFYCGRLSSSFAGLPLYVTFCCQGGSSSSSSSSGN